MLAIKKTFPDKEKVIGVYRALN